MAGGIVSKRSLIDKSNQSLVIITGIAAFLTVFSLVASKTLFSQAAYQNRVISEKNKAVAQLRSDITAGKQLQSSYKDFEEKSPNAIGGNASGNGPKDGSNPKIILDALPSTYDFPALATSLEKLITDVNGLKITSISGTDDQVTQGANLSSTTPQPVPMPFQVVVTGDYQAIKGLVGKFEHSIRPFQIQTISLSGDQANLTLTISAQTYYQPAKSLNITTKVVK